MLVKIVGCMLAGVLMLPNGAFSMTDNASLGDAVQENYEMVNVAQYDVDQEITASIQACGAFFPTYHYIKVYYTNRTSKDATVFIQDSNGQNIALPLVVDANSSDDISLNVEMVPGDTYYYSIVSPSGSLVPDGHLVIRTATTKRELS